MRKLLISALSIIASAIAVSAEESPKWQLVWADEFNSEELDTTVWSRIPRGEPDWQNTQSADERLLGFRDGKLILRGIVNNDTLSDPTPFLTAGIWTHKKKSFNPGRFEVRVRLHGAKGAWPAVWLMPFESEKYKWPTGGEIDILERLNNNHIVYQTVHSHYIEGLDNYTNPRNGGVYPIDNEDFNIYGVEIHPDRLDFFVNGERTLRYPKINDGKDGQFPFYIPQHIRIDMQLGGKWVGEVDPADLPVEMEVDWVRYYELK